MPDPTKTPKKKSKLRGFYTKLKEKGVAPNIPDYDTFNSTLQNEDARKNFYNNLKNNSQLALPDYKTFSKTLFNNTLNSKVNGNNTSKPLPQISAQTGDLNDGHTVPLPKNGDKSVSGEKAFEIKRRRSLIKRLQNLKDKLRARSGSLRNEGRATDKSIPNLDILKRADEIKHKADTINDRLSYLKEQQLYDTGTDEDRAEMNEGGLQRSVEEFGKGIGRGVVNLPKYIATIGANLGQDPQMRFEWQKAADYLQGINESETLAPDRDLEKQSLSSVYDSPSKLIPYLSGKVGEAVPTMLPGLGTAKLLEGAGAATQILGAALASSPLEVGSQLEDAQNTASQQGRKPTAGEKALAVGSGMLASVLEGVGDVSILKNITGGIAKEFTDEAAREAALKEAGEKLTDFAVYIAKKSGKSFSTEGITEGAQQYIENKGAELGWDPTRNPLDGILESTLVGGLTGFGTTAVASSIGLAVNNYNYNKDVNQTQRESLNVPYLEQASPKDKRANMMGDLMREGGAQKADTEHQQQQPQTLQQPVEIQYDPEADAETQANQLDNERNRLESIRDSRIANGEDTADVEALIAKVDELHSDILEQNDTDVQKNEPFTEREQEQNVNKDQRPVPPQQEVDNSTVQQESDIDVPDVQGKVNINNPTNNETKDTNKLRQEEHSKTRVFRETNIDNAEKFLPNSNTDTGDAPNNIHVSDNPDLAIGQGKNKGVQLEFNTDLSNERPSRSKPGLAISKGDEYILNRSPEKLREDLVRIKISPDAEANTRGKALRFKLFANRLVENQGWNRYKDDDGNVIYERQSSEKESNSPVLNFPTIDNPLPARVDDRYESFIATDESGMPQIKVRKTDSGEEVNYRSNNRKGIIVDYIRQGGKGLKSAEDVLDETLSDPDVQDAEKEATFHEAYDGDELKPEYVFKNSNDPAEISEAIEKGRNNRISKRAGDVHKYILDHYWGNRVLPEREIREWGDMNQLDDGKGGVLSHYNRRVTNTEKGDQKYLHAENIASEVSGIMKKDVSPQDVVESFIQSEKEQFGNRGNRFYSDIVNRLADKFKDITGQKYTKDFGDDIIIAKSEHEANKRNVERNEIIDAARHYIDKKGNINYSEVLQDDGLNGFLTNNKPLTQEETENVNQKIKQYQQRKEGNNKRTRGGKRQNISGDESVSEANTEVAQNEGQQQITPTQTDKGSIAPQQFNDDINPVVKKATSQNLEEAVPAARKIVKAGLDNGVKDHLELIKWSEDATGGAINYKALNEAWKQELSDEANQEMLDINNKRGSAWEKFKKSAHGLSYPIIKSAFVYNQRASDIEAKFRKTFGDDYFSGKNSDFLISWAMDRVPGQVGALIDKYINPHKKYSVLNHIIKQIAVHPEVNTVNFSEIQSLYDDLGRANQNNLPAKAEKIQQKIDALSKQDDLQQYLIARHVPESNAYSQENNADEIAQLQEDIKNLKDNLSQTSLGLPGSYEMRASLQERIQSKEDALNKLQYPLGVTNKEAEQILEGFKERGISDALDNVAQPIWALNNAMLSMAVDNGVITQEDANNMRAVYKKHIPANRHITDDNGRLISSNNAREAVGQGSPRIYNREGSNRMIGHVLSNIVSNMQDMIKYAKTNKSNIRISKSIERETKKGNEFLGYVIDTDQAKPTDTITEFRRPETVKVYNEDGTITAKEVMKKKSIVWNDPEMAKAMNRSDMLSTDGLPVPVVQSARAFMNLMRFTLTGGNPSFLLSNGVKDSQDATYNVLNRSGINNPFAIIKNEMLPEFKNNIGERAEWNERVFAIHRAIKDYENGLHDKNDLTRIVGEAKSEGALSQFFRFRDQSHIIGDINKLIDHTRALEHGSMTNPKTYKALIKDKIEILELWNESLENATRVTVYKTLRDAVYSKNEAARLAKEATVNFDMKGNWSPWFKISKLFLQVSLNSITSMAKGHVYNPKAAIASDIAAVISGMALRALYSSVRGEDEYRKDKEENVYKWNGTAPLPLPGHYDLNIPLGYQVSTFTSLGGHLYDYLHGYTDTKTFLGRASSAAVDVWNPFGGSEMFTDSHYFARSLSPTILQPFVDVYVNRSFFGKIYNPYKDADPTIPDWQLRSPGNRRFSIYLSEWLAHHNLLDISPKTFDHFVNFLEGGLGKDIEKTGVPSKAIDLLMGKNKTPSDSDHKINPDEWPILRRFLDDVQPTKVAYNYIWNTITKYDDPKPLMSKDMGDRLKLIKKEYNQVVKSKMFPDYMLDGMGKSIQNYIDINFKKSQIDRAVNYFRQNGLTGNENKNKRRGYYRIENMRSQKQGVPYIKWENGSFHIEPSKRKRFNKQSIKKIEMRVDTPDAKIE